MVQTDTCTQCRQILGKIVKRHRPEECPLLKGSYCGLCASYGHSPSGCPDILTKAYREPQFVEQLVAPSLLETYGIRTQTLLPMSTVSAAAAAAPSAILEVPETDEALRAALMVVGVKPMICQEKGKKEHREITENKKRLQKVADAKGQKLIFVAVPGSRLPAAAPKDSKTLVG